MNNQIENENEGPFSIWNTASKAYKEAVKNSPPIMQDEVTDLGVARDNAKKHALDAIIKNNEEKTKELTKLNSRLDKQIESAKKDYEELRKIFTGIARLIEGAMEAAGVAKNVMAP